MVMGYVSSNDTANVKETKMEMGQANDN